MPAFLDPRAALRAAFALPGAFGQDEPPDEGLGASPYAAAPPPMPQEPTPQAVMPPPVATEPEADWSPAPRPAAPVGPTLRSTAPSITEDARRIMADLPSVPRPEPYQRPQPIRGFRGHLKAFGQSMIPGFDEGRAQADALRRHEIDTENARQLAEYNRQMQVLSPLLNKQLAAEEEVAKVRKKLDWMRADPRFGGMTDAQMLGYATGHFQPAEKIAQAEPVIYRMQDGKSIPGIFTKDGKFLDMEGKRVHPNVLTQIVGVDKAGTPQRDPQEKDPLFKQKLDEFRGAFNRDPTEDEKLRIFGAAEPREPQGPQESWGGAIQPFTNEKTGEVRYYQTSNRGTIRDVTDQLPGLRKGMATPAQAQKVWGPAQDADTRLSVMEKAAKSGSQGDVSLLFNHIGMTLSAQRGARITQAEIERAIHTRSIPEGLLAAYESAASGRFLSPQQREQMIKLAREMRREQWLKARGMAQSIGVGDEPPGHPDLPALPVVGAAPTAGAGQVHFRASDGQEWTIPAANLEAARKRDPGLKVIQ